jgi:hypothetical protein
MRGWKYNSFGGKKVCKIFPEKLFGKSTRR